MEILLNNAYRVWMNHSKGAGIITIFTPTYNRAKFLDRIYGCLLSQFNKNFVWILVNDGSTDDTSDVAHNLINRNDFPAMFISKDNGHKHSCFKVALENCRTEYFMCMDDDDIYSPNSVDFFLNEWNIIKREGVGNIGAIRTLTKGQDGKYLSNVPIADSDVGKKEDISTLERNYILHIDQENWTCYETDKLNEIDLFPIDYWLHNEHRFFLESIWQGRFARKYKCRYINLALREYCVDAPVSIIRNQKGRQHYIDMFINYFILTNEQYDYLYKNKMMLLKQTVMLQCLRYYLHIDFMEMICHTEHKGLKLLFGLTFPLSYFGKIIIQYRNRE